MPPKALNCDGINGGCPHRSVGLSHSEVRRIKHPPMPGGHTRIRNLCPKCSEEWDRKKKVSKKFTD
jgi:hypothetical protein